MSAQIVLSCNGHFPLTGDGPVFPCRGALPTGASSIARAREIARQQGWSCSPGRDLCPAHTRAASSP